MSLVRAQVGEPNKNKQLRYIADSLKTPCIHHVSEKRILVGQSAKIDAFGMDTREQLAREKHHHSLPIKPAIIRAAIVIICTARLDGPLPHSARRV